MGSITRSFANLITADGASGIPDGTVTNADLAGSISTDKLAGNINFKNIFINGDMSIAQRSTSESSLTSSGFHTVDRFQSIIASQGTWTQSRSTDVPSGQGFVYSLKMDCTTADASPASSDSLRIRQNIEGQFLQYLKKGTSSAESITASFWVKSNKTGTYIFEIFDTDNARYLSKTYTINSASTWEKKTITFEPDTSGTIDNDSGGSFECTWWLGAGTNFTSGTLATDWANQNNANRAVGQVNLADSDSNEWYITGVQLEAGTSASDFEFLPNDINKTRCERYYMIRRGGVSKPTTGGFSCMTEQFTVNTETMRAQPSYTYSDLANDTGGTATFKQFGNYWQQTNYGIPSAKAHYVRVKFDSELG